MRGEKFKRDLRATFSLVRIWNEFPKEAVEVDTIVTFNRDLDRYMDRKGLGGYGSNSGKWPGCRPVLAALSWLMGLFSGCVSKGMWVQRRRMGPAQYANGWHGQDGTKGLDDSNHDVFLVQVLEMGSIELNQKKINSKSKAGCNSVLHRNTLLCFLQWTSAEARVYDGPGGSQWGPLVRHCGRCAGV